MTRTASLGDGPAVQAAGFPGIRVQGPGFRVQGPGFRVQGSGFRDQGQERWDFHRGVQHPGLALKPTSPTGNVGVTPDTSTLKPERLNTLPTQPRGTQARLPRNSRPRDSGDKSHAGIAGVTLHSHVH